MKQKKHLAPEGLDPAPGTCLEIKPYRMVIFHRYDHYKTPLYLVAGSAAPAQGARKALKEAHRMHGGVCFYCAVDVATEDLTLDHAVPVKAGGSDDLGNLLIACRACNSDKRDRPIEAFNPVAGRAWLSAVLRDAQKRLNRLG